MEVGSHGMTHTSFTKLSNDELLSELIQSKDVLKQHSKSDCCSIAFPYGDYDSRTIEACKKAGYTLLFGTEKSLQTPDKMLINERFTINPFVTAINQMYYIAKGNYE